MDRLKRHGIDIQSLKRFPVAATVVFGLLYLLTTGVDTARYIATDIDQSLNPAGEVYHERTRIVSASRGIGGYKPGDNVMIFGSGKRLREDCEIKFKRTLIWPDGTQSNLPDGMPTQQVEGGVYIIVATQDWWPVGNYEYKSEWVADCNAFMPPQRIEGITAKFTLN